MAEAEKLDREMVLSWTTRIPWETYPGVGEPKVGGPQIFLEKSDIRAIRRFATASPSELSELLATGDEDARRYPAALLTVLQKLTDIRVLQYALTLIEDFLSVDSANRARFFTEAASRSAGAGHAYSMYLPFLQLIGVSGTGAVISALDANTYVVERAATCVALLVVASAEADPSTTAGILSWSMTHIRNYGAPNAKQAKVTEVAMATLRILLRLGMMRELFVAERGVESLLPPLSARNTQLLYDTVFCMWALSLDKDIAPHLERTGAVAGVARLARPTMPLKVLRMSLAMLANCLRVPDSAASSDALSEIVESHVPETVDALLGQEPKISDPELLDDLRYLKEAARSGRRKLTSLERYERDLHARRFEWTMVHSSDFWKENASAFEADGFKLIERVRDLLADPEGAVDETTQAVALFDLGEFAVQHPQGRTILASLNVRPVVMAMLAHADDEVRQQALLTCSKMLVAKWQFVSGLPAAGGAGAGAAVAAGAGKR